MPSWTTNKLRSAGRAGRGCWILIAIGDRLGGGSARRIPQNKPRSRQTISPRSQPSTAPTSSVDHRDDATPAQVAAIQRDLGIELQLVDSNEARTTQLYRARVAPGTEAATIAALATRPEVEIAEPDSIMQLDPAEVAAAPEIAPAHAGFPNDSRYEAVEPPPDRHARRVEARAGQRRDRRGARYRRRLRGLRQVPPAAGSQGPDVRSTCTNFISNTTAIAADDDHGHGSHVTGTIAQATNNGIGVAGIALLDVKIMPIKVLSGSGSGSIAEYCRRHPVRRRSRREGHQHVARRRVPLARVLKKSRRVRAQEGRDRHLRRRQRRGRPAASGYPAAYPGARWR